MYIHNRHIKTVRLSFLSEIQQFSI